MKKNLTINMFTLKIIAAITMTIDHIGGMFFPGQLYWICIGRLAFPIYCYLIANGFFYTRSKLKYLIRLVVCAFLSQLPFIAMYWYERHSISLLFAADGMFSSPARFFTIGFVHLNSIFTLSIGLVAIICLDVARKFFANKNQPVLGVVLGCIPGAVLVWVCMALQCDYAILGVPLMVAFYTVTCISRNDPDGSNTKVAFWTLPLLAIFVYMMTRSIQSSFPMRQWMYGLCQGLAMIPIAMYQGDPGPRYKALQYGFYLFYPVHMAALVAIALAVA